MKTILSTLCLLGMTVANAQIDNRFETDCSSETRNLYAILEQGIPVIVASKGFDCGICISSADNVAEFADQNVGNVAVWGAMAYRYSPVTPDCATTEDWVQTHGWGNIFTFPDVDEYWFGTGFPTYTVIDPSTYEIAFMGGSFSTATSTALNLVTLSTGEFFDANDLFIYAGKDMLDLRIGVKNPSEVDIALFNITGQSIGSFRQPVAQGSNSISIPFSFPDGIYIATISAGAIRVSKKFLVQNQ